MATCIKGKPADADRGSQSGNPVRLHGEKRQSRFSNASPVVEPTGSSTVDQHTNLRHIVVMLSSALLIMSLVFAVVLCFAPEAAASPLHAHDQFAYAAVPRITSVDPRMGSEYGGTTVTIRGSGFVRVNRVLFGNVAALSYRVNNYGQITAVSPAGSGTVYITVMTRDGTTAASPDNRFVYVAAPRIASVEPRMGSGYGGTVVTIRGSGFVGVSRVLFGTTAARSYTVHNSLLLTAVSPAHSGGTVDVRVITFVGTTAASPRDQFTYVTAPPYITSISPRWGPESGGTWVTIHGRGFVDVQRVLFGNRAALSYRVDSSLQIEALSPAGRGIVYVTVITPNGTVAASHANQYQYIR